MHHKLSDVILLPLISQISLSRVLLPNEHQIYQLINSLAVCFVIWMKSILRSFKNWLSSQSYPLSLACTSNSKIPSSLEKQISSQMLLYPFSNAYLVVFVLFFSHIPSLHSNDASRIVVMASMPISGVRLRFICRSLRWSLSRSITKLSCSIRICKTRISKLLVAKLYMVAYKRELKTIQERKLSQKNLNKH